MKRCLIPLVLTMLVTAACGSLAAPQTSDGFNKPIPNRLTSRDNGPGVEGAPTVPVPGAAQMQVVLVPSELALGPNRFAVGLFDSKGQMIHNASVHLQYYDLSNPASARLESEADAVRLDTPDGLDTIFAHERSFDRAGNWGVAVQAQFPNGTSAMQRIGFQVVASSPTLKVGQKVPPVETITAKGVNGDLMRLTSAPEPNPAFYRLSLAQAITSAKPTVLLLATPAFCQSRLCGPAYDTTSELEKRFGDRLNFVHVEVYTGLPDPALDNWELAPAMKALGLETEPWLYLIDKGGTVAFRVEGLFTADEVDRHVRALLNSN